VCPKPVAHLGALVALGDERIVGREPLSLARSVEPSQDQTARKTRVM